MTVSASQTVGVPRTGNCLPPLPASRARPLFSLIVCTIGRRDTLARLLASLQRQSLDDFEVVLVDQNPPGYLDALLQTWRGVVVRQVRSPAGLSRARNVGLRHALGGLILFPDDDCWYADDFLSRLQAAFVRFPEHDILTGRTVDAGGTDSVSVALPASGRIDRSVVLAAGNS